MVEQRQVSYSKYHLSCSAYRSLVNQELFCFVKTGLDRCQDGTEKDLGFVDGMETHI
jgi:hypothetical protein